MMLLGYWYTTRILILVVIKGQAFDSCMFRKPLIGQFYDLNHPIMRAAIIDSPLDHLGSGLKSPQGVERRPFYGRQGRFRNTLMPWVQIAHCKWDSNSANIFQLCGFLQTENIGLSTYPLVIKHDWKIFHDWFGDFHSYKPNQLEKGMSQLTHRLLRLFPGPNASVAARHLDAWRQLAGGKILQSISKIW